MVKIIYILIKKKVITLKNLKEMLLKGENKNIKRILYLFVLTKEDLIFIYRGNTN
jgi:hypothetical protein